MNFGPGERTEVEVTFRPRGRKTEITVEHRGWSALRPDHPVRHGRVGADFSGEMGLWWGGLGTALREYAERKK